MKTDLQTSLAIDIDGLVTVLGGSRILNALHIQIHKGDTHVIIGGSGQGKSVLLKSMIGLIKPDHGTIHVAGIDITQGKKKDLLRIRQKTGYLFQGAALLNSISVFDNVALPLREHGFFSDTKIREMVMNKLTIVGLEDSAEKMPSTLSGGMKKRVGLARAIIREPEIILYDEPTSGLDPQSTRTIEELIIDMKTTLSVTSIVVTHDMESAFRIADHISMLKAGQIIKTGTSEEFKNSDSQFIRKFIEGDIGA